VLLVDELSTRLVPIGLAEGAYARNRDPAERPPWPRVGDLVWYRRNEWDTDEQLHEMLVVAVQDRDDRTSQWAPNLWQAIRDNTTGAPVLDASGQPLIVPVADPWPWVHLRWPDGRDIGKGAEHGWKHNMQMTWESRVRGSAGWLPGNYQAIRRVRLPGQVMLRPLPAAAGPLRNGG
jgi:hypothetical protein